MNDFRFCHLGIDSGPWSMWWVTPSPQELWLISAEKTLSKKGSRWEKARIHQWIDLVRRVQNNLFVYHLLKDVMTRFPVYLVWFERQIAKWVMVEDCFGLYTYMLGVWWEEQSHSLSLQLTISPSWVGTAGLVPLEQLQKGNSTHKPQFIVFLYLCVCMD